MFARVFALLPLALLVAANQCETESPNCCNPNADQTAVDNALKALGFGGLIGTVAATVGLGAYADCTAIVGNGADCHQTPVCCSKNLMGGISVGCSPVDL